MKQLNYLIHLKIPEDAVTGTNLRMRIMVANTGSSDPCNMPDVGDASDYTLFVNPPGELTFNDASVDENQSQLQIPVNLSLKTFKTFDIGYEVVFNGDADASDVSTTSGTLTFEGTPGEVQNITIDITNDSDVEENETFEVKLNDISANGMAKLPENGITVTINDDNDNSLSVDTNKLDNNEVVLYPNPVITKLNYKLGNRTTFFGSVSVVDIYGRIIKNKKISTNEGEISVANLASGIYFIKITDTNGKEFINEFLKL